MTTHAHGLLLTKVTEVDYVAGATHSDWDKALTALNAVEADWLQIRLGQGLTGHPPPDDVLVVLEGSGENGKSTILDACSTARGCAASTSDPHAPRHWRCVGPVHVSRSVRTGWPHSNRGAAKGVVAGIVIPARWDCDAIRRPSNLRPLRRIVEHGKASPVTGRTGSHSPPSTRRWRKLRAAKLRANPICEMPDCRRSATEVDHVISLAAGGDRWAHGSGVCRPCHAAKTVADRRRR